MSEFTKALLVANIYRYLLIIAGIVFAYMGYRLFKLGYFEKAGELRASFGEHHFLLKQVAPGVFFALLGVATIAAGVVRTVRVSVPVAILNAENGTVVPAEDTEDPCTDLMESERYEGTKRGGGKKTGGLQPEKPRH